ncbi:isocitrate/isopropylmalate family dehydrogenase [Streptomyces sp. Ag109_G2-15]|uniref:isocitrate/isopropylmalate family dehydrogenase n=1 Tax=Streptomyces sp. Ag109_G2-15 TaxID=1938850 RepID=UPI000D1C0906|nr:isocitrate/isopropylmalate family dehydrogenase [Streptomyces sp. Ag109_G2-15]
MPREQNRTCSASATPNSFFGPFVEGDILQVIFRAVLSAALMLEHFGLPDEAARLHRAIEATTAAGILTRDVGGTASTEDVPKALSEALNS